MTGKGHHSNVKGSSSKIFQLQVSLTLIIWGLRDEQSAVKQSAFLPAPAESLIANVMRLIDRQVGTLVEINKVGYIGTIVIYNL